MSARRTAARRWGSHAVAARAVAICLRSAPVVAGVAVSVVLAILLPAPQGATQVTLWWTTVAGVPLVVVVATERSVRRWAPLPFLLRLALVFPGEAPARLQVLRETRRASHLIARLRDSRIDEEDLVPPTAASTLALVTALQRHDRFTRGHSERVALYAELIGEQLELSSADRERLRWAALLHDIGKLRVDAGVLNKNGRPDDDEWRQIQRHPRLGLRLAAPLLPWLGAWAGAIGEHHERWDGRGYPAGVAGEEISLAGRIVEVADAYETMTAGRPYRQAMDHGQARAELVSCAGAQFDPQVVRVFLRASLPAQRWSVGLLAWMLQLPILTKLRAAPPSALQGAALVASVASMAAVGLIAPGPSAPPSSPEAASGIRADGGTNRPSPDPVGTPHPASEGSERIATGQPEPDAPASDDAAREPRETGDRPADGSASQPDDGDGGSEPEAPRKFAHSSSPLGTTLYLRAASSRSRRHDVLPLSPEAPDREQLGNYDTDVDGLPGIRLRPTDRGRSAAELDRRQRWGLSLDAFAATSAPLELTLWARAADSGTSVVQVEAFLDRCTEDVRDCRPLTEGRSTWTSASTEWEEAAVSLPPAVDVAVDGRRSLVLTVTAGPASTGDVLLAFDTTDHPAVLRIPHVAVPEALVPVPSEARRSRWREFLGTRLTRFATPKVARPGVAS